MANPTDRVPIATTDYDDRMHYRGLANTGSTFYPGEMIGVNSAGYGAKLDDTAAMSFDGVNGESLRFVGSSAGDGVERIQVKRPAYFEATIAAAVITDIGQPVFALYSNEVSYHPGTYHNFVGHVARYVSATRVLVEPTFRSGPNLVRASYDYSAPADKAFFVADRAYLVIDIRLRVDVVGSDGGAVIAEIKKANSGTAIASGTLLHTGNGNLKGTANTNQVLTLSATTTDLRIAAGQAIGIDVTGTTTAAIGNIQVTMIPIGG